jgi:hypothetical protein
MHILKEHHFNSSQNNVTDASPFTLIVERVVSSISVSILLSPYLLHNRNWHIFPVSNPNLNHTKPTAQNRLGYWPSQTFQPSGH